MAILTPKNGSRNHVCCCINGHVGFATDQFGFNHGHFWFANHFVWFSRLAMIHTSCFGSAGLLGDAEMRQPLSRPVLFWFSGPVSFRNVVAALFCSRTMCFGSAGPFRLETVSAGARQKFENTAQQNNTCHDVPRPLGQTDEHNNGLAGEHECYRTHGGRPTHNASQAGWGWGDMR